MSWEMAPRRTDRSQQNVTRLLLACGEGDREAFDQLVPLVYSELHQIARRQLHRLRPGDTLSTTGLVHEAYVKLVDQERAGWKDRNHFYSIAARAMRQVLVDYARRKLTAKHGAGVARVTLDEALISARESDEAWLIELHVALDRLEEIDARLPRVVECLYFAGYTLEETATALDVSVSTVRRDARAAKAWLRQELGDAS